MSPRSANKFRQEKISVPPDFSAFKNNIVAVGLPDDVIHNPSKLPMSELGIIHEFGSSDGRIPARRPLRLFAETSKDDARRLLLTAARRVVRGNDAESELEKIAIWAQNMAQQSYVDVDDPPLADSTLRRKKGKRKTTAAAEAKLKSAAEDTLNNPLIATGEMKDAVIGQVQPND